MGNGFKIAAYMYYWSVYKERRTQYLYSECIETKMHFVESEKKFFEQILVDLDLQN